MNSPMHTTLLRRDEGSVTVMAAVLATALLLVLALVVDGQARLRAISRADALAAEAARAALTAVNTRGNSIVVDHATAVRAAQSYLAATGHPGTVTFIGARSVEVHVTITAPEPIGLLGGSFTTTGTATADLRVGVRTAGNP